MAAEKTGVGGPGQVARTCCLVLNYERTDAMNDTIGDLLCQDRKYEIFVVDNGSKDVFESKYKSVTVLRSDVNRYFCGGFNWGLSQIMNGYDFIYLVTDVRIDQRYLVTKMVTEMLDHPRTVLIQASCEQNDCWTRPAKRRGIVEVPRIEMTNAMLRVQAYREIGAFDERLLFWGMEDDWCYRAKLKKYVSMIDFDLRVLHTYAGSPNHMLTDRRSDQWFKVTEDVLRQKYGLEWFDLLQPDDDNRGWWRSYQQRNRIRF